MNLRGGASASVGRVRTAKLWLLAALVMGSLSACDQDNAQPKTVSAAHAEPQVEPTVANLNPIELSAVILDAMPPEGTTALDRGALVNDPIAWIGDESLWVGGARIRVGGTRAISYSTEPPKEIEWTISVGKSNEIPKLDSSVILINVGPCSNDTDKDCTFSADQAFASPGVKAVALCKIPRDNGSKDYYRVTSPGRAPMIAAYDHGKGDVGSTSILELALAATATVPCGSSGDSLPADSLTTLIPRCSTPNGCNDLDKPVWQRFESDTGEITKLDTASVQPAQGAGAIAVIYTYSPGSLYDPRRLRQVLFTCQGQFADLSSSPSDPQDAPPRSVIGMVAASACGLAEPKRRAIFEKQRQLDAIAHDRAIHPRPEDYCQGFSQDSCARIQAGVDDPTKPSFCKPGFGLVGSGLTSEQLRICYARAPKDDG
jgi:hypothetical protein